MRFAWLAAFGGLLLLTSACSALVTGAPDGGGDGSLGDGSSDGASGDGRVPDGGPMPDLGPMADGGPTMDGGGGDACVPTGVEICNGVDDDCNGLVDDGVGPRSCYSGAAGTAGHGLCVMGTQACSAGAFGLCTGEVDPTAEACDGLDNDCDGVIDNGCPCAAGTTRACYSGPPSTSGVGLCTGGTQSCSAAGWGVCVGEVVPTAELCDGMDNDCDGTTDGMVQSCYSGASGTAGVGACRAGMQTCVAGTFGACMGEVDPSAELCDGMDNDCDGTIDGQMQPCYTGPAGTSGVGVCHGGMQTCAAGAFGACMGELTPSAEVCNGMDDDCNGVADDGNPGGGVSCGPSLGACVSMTACIAGAVVCRGTFVGPAPVGGAGNPGTQAMPVDTIGAAIANAVAIGGGADVCVCDPAAAGPTTYTEAVTMVEGTSVIGGYNCAGWARAIGTYVTRIQDVGHNGVAVPPGVTSVTAIDGMTVLGQVAAAGTTSAITVTDASPTLVDDTVSGGAAPTSIGLRVVRSASGASSPTITRGAYQANATGGGTQTGVSLETTQATFNMVNVTMPGAGGVVLAATSVGVRCSDCGATSITGGTMNGGTSTSLAVGLWASGNVTGLAATGAPSFLGGDSGAAGTSRGVWLDVCSGAPTFNAPSAIGGFGGYGGTGSRIGVDVTGAACNPTVTGGSMIGCENGATCTGFQSSGAPATVTGATLIRGGVSTSAATYGVRCLRGGCTTFTRNTITAGNFTGAGRGIGMGVDLENSSPLFDGNNVRGPSCGGPVVPMPGQYYGVMLTASNATLENNVVRDNACNQLSEVVRFVKDPVTSYAPVIVENTIEYTACTTCGERRGFTVVGAPGRAASSEGTVNDNIIRNTAAGGVTYPVYEYDVDGDTASFLNNDLYDPTSTAAFWYHGTTPYTVPLVNAMVAGAAANIASDCALTATWHLPASLPNLCRNGGTASGAPDHDFDPQPRPAEGVYDIGADEYTP